MKRSLICCNLLLKSLLNEHAILLSNRLLMLLRLQWLCFPQNYSGDSGVFGSCCFVRLRQIPTSLLKSLKK